MLCMSYSRNNFKYTASQLERPWKSAFRVNEGEDGTLRSLRRSNSEDTFITKLATFYKMKCLSPNE